MRHTRQAISASLLLPYLFSLSSAAATELDHVADLADGGPGIELGLPHPQEPIAGVLSSPKVTAPKSTVVPRELALEAVLPDAKDTKIANKDAPVDGKDGRPHEGPFVETEAERGRKKAKASGDDELPSVGKKPTPKDVAGSDGLGHALPETNDGVMDDPARVAPKEGTTGTEGGISEKSRERLGNTNGGQGALKVPEEPKAAPPLPHSEQEKLSDFEAQDKATEKNRDQSKGSTFKDAAAKDKSGKDDEKDYDELELGGLRKPDDLPDKPHEIPHPLPNTGIKDNPLDIKPIGSSKLITPGAEPAGIIQPLHSFVLSFTMIIFSEIGDKTFIVAALMAMKHSPLLVFFAAFPALLVMTVLSAVLGHAVPTLLPVQFTSFAAAILFLVFGAKMLREGLAMKTDEGIGEEMREVEMELDQKEQLAAKLGRRRSSITPYMLESGRSPAGRKARTNSRLPAPPDSPPSSPDSRSPSPSARGSTLSGTLTGFYNLFSFLLSPAWVQTFVMTFLGEWGDRSQIATIAMAAGPDYWFVTSGALVGHAICTAVAVIGGRAIAGRVSLRVVTLGGAFAFLVFGFVYLAEAFYYRGS